MAADSAPSQNSSDRSDLLSLVAAAIEALETEGEVAYERFLARYGEHREKIDLRVRGLRGAGLVGGQGNDLNLGGPAAGERIGSYRIVRRIGEGGMGIVFLAEDERLRRLVALKTIPAHFGMSETARLRLVREAGAVAKLSHPAIIPVYESGEQSGVPWFAMEYAPGKTLGDVIRGLTQSKIPPAELTRSDLEKQVGGTAVAANLGTSFVHAACRIVIAVAEGLQHAHEQGVLHRDVKPSNVMVDSKGRARLFDFGLARVDDALALTRTRDFAGTPYYASPEQIVGRAEEIDARTDVWSLGVLLFEFLTLRVPFEGDTTEQVLKNICEVEPPRPRRFNSSISRDLETVVLAAIEKSKARRYDGCKAFADDLRRAVSGEPVAARPASNLTRVVRLAARRKTATAAIFLSAVLVIGVPLGLFVKNRQIEALLEQTEKAQKASKHAFEFLGQVILDSDVEELGPETPIRVVIERGLKKIESGLENERDVKSALLRKVGAFMLDLSQFEDAERALEESLAIQESDHPAGDLDTASTLNFLGNLYRARGERAKAESVLRRALAIRERLHEELSVDGIATSINLADLLAMEMGEIDEAKAVLQSLLTKYESRPDRDASSLGSIYKSRAQIEYRTRDWSSAIEDYHRSIESFESAGRGRSIDSAAAHSGLARVLLDSGDFAAATSAFEIAYAVQASLLGEAHWITASTRGYIAEVRSKSKQYPAALELYLPSLEQIRRSVGTSSDAFREASLSCVDAAFGAGRLDFAEWLLDGVDLGLAAPEDFDLASRIRVLSRRAVLAKRRGDLEGARIRLCEQVELVRPDPAAREEAKHPNLDAAIRYLAKNGNEDLSAQLERLRAAR